MQSMAKSTDPKILAGGKKTVLGTLSHIYTENGIKGLYRGVAPRIGLGVWQTICMGALAHLPFLHIFILPD